MIQTTDQLGNKITLHDLPQRIVSLVPSQTEFLFHIGLGHQLVGITNFCIHPPSEVFRVGGTKNFSVEKIKQLNPDLIIGNKEENYREGIEELRKTFPVWMSDVNTLQEAYGMMQALGRLCGKETETEQVVQQIQKNFAQYAGAVSPSNARCAYFIWRKPYMVAASNTFIDDMLQQLGCVNVFCQRKRYPEIELEILADLKPDFIFLSSEPYRFTSNHFDEFLQHSPQSKVILVNGEMFSWYGSALLKTPDYFMELRKTMSGAQ